MANRVVGVDFGHGVVRGVEVDDPGTRRQRVLRYGTVPVDPDDIVSGEVRDPGAVAATLKQLWSKAGFRSRRVVIGMGNSRVLARDLQVPVRPLAQIREGLQFLVADLLPMPIDNAVLDYYPIATMTDAGGGTIYDGMLVAALKDVVLQNAKAVERAGLELVGVDFVPFALVRALGDRASSETVAFVDVGATSTIIAIATGSVPEFVRIIPMGGEDVTRSLMQLGDLNREQAEQIKRVVGLSADDVEPRYRPVVELMVARSSELMTALRDTIQYFVDTRRRRVSGIALSGGGARLGRFAETVTAWTQIPASRVELGDESPDAMLALALASGARTAVDVRSASTRVAPPIPEPTAPETAVESEHPVETDATSREVPSGEPPPKQDRRAAKTAKAATSGRKESFWNRPIGGAKR